MSALALPGLSAEPCCVDNHSISSRYQSRIATVIHITAYDLTNCTRSEPFVASLCGSLWSAFTHASGRAFFSLLPRNCHSAGGLLETCVPRYAPPTCGGSVLTGFQMPECCLLGQGSSGSGPSLGTRHALARATSGQTGTEMQSNRNNAHSLMPTTPYS